MWQIAARLYAATNGTVNAEYFSLLYEKRIGMARWLCLDKSSDE